MSKIDEPTIGWLIDEICPNKGNSPLVNFNKGRLKKEIDRAVLKGKIEVLKLVTEENYDEMHGTYDFDGIAEDVLAELKKLDEK